MQTPSLVILMPFPFRRNTKWASLKRAKEQKIQREWYFVEEASHIGFIAWYILDFKWNGEKNDRNGPYAFIFMDTLNFHGHA